ncbi:ATP-binding cassette domain-containing protein [Streptomyces sp. TLI_171]|uniref:ATP-binding cassette domain-containing protein n=1 Tax=Streptomyces sp. TLI_171 TaxID=1938859 RepID=UPI000C188ECD|nr:ATP-binding cassette domain-containing protein [Streptomyces sp. TLI_171]RKE20746.1 NHLM bacteriocin system ABC transporter ATP-binding protein [Streptomyces sp. TLI_171]
MSTATAARQGGAQTAAADTERDPAIRVDATAAANRTALADALAELGTAAPRPQTSPRPGEQSPTAPRHRADRAREVLRALGVDVPGELPAAVRDAADPVTALLRRAGVRWRPVTLPDGNETGTAGPMVAFAAEDGRPIALIPRAGRHRRHDPDSERAAARAELSRQALLLYPPLPPGSPTPGTLLRFALAVPGARRDLGVLTAAGLVSALLGLLVPLSTGVLLPGLLLAERHPVRWLAVLLGSAVVASWLLTLVRNTAAVRLTGRVQHALEPAVWDRLLAQDARFFRDYTTGDLVHRANAVAQARQALSEVLVGAVLGAVFAVTGLTVLLLVDWRLGGLLLLAVLAVTAVLLLLGRRRQEYESQVFEAHGQLQGVLYGLLLGIDKIQTAGREIQAFARWAAPFAGQKRADAAAMRSEAVSTALTTALQPLLLAVLLAGATFGPAAEAGHLMAAGVAAGQVALALGQVTHAAAGAYGVAPVLERLRPILAEPAVNAAERAGRLADPGRLEGRLALDQVVFRYPGSALPALDGVSLRAEPGEFVAVVGPSGAGKSTLIRLLLGFEQPESGAIRYDGRELAALDARLVRRQLGSVLQHGRMLRGSLLENLAGADPDITEDRIWHAAELAGIAEELRALPMGLGTRVGEDAQGFSGGQVQRLLLARALVRDPAVLLLDEATSALDNATQQRVADAVAGLDRTRLVIAHRLSTIRTADRIYVLDGGRVSAEGTFRELLGTDPLFTRLARFQEM